MSPDVLHQTLPQSQSRPQPGRGHRRRHCHWGQPLILARLLLFIISQTISLSVAEAAIWRPADNLTTSIKCQSVIGKNYCTACGTGANPQSPNGSDCTVVEPDVPHCKSLAPGCDLIENWPNRRCNGRCKLLGVENCRDVCSNNWCPNFACLDTMAFNPDILCNNAPVNTRVIYMIIARDYKLNAPPPPVPFYPPEDFCPATDMWMYVTVGVVAFFVVLLMIITLVCWAKPTNTAHQVVYSRSLQSTEGAVNNSLGGRARSYQGGGGGGGGSQILQTTQSPQITPSTMPLFDTTTPGRRSSRARTPRSPL